MFSMLGNKKKSEMFVISYKTKQSAFKSNVFYVFYNQKFLAVIYWCRYCRTKKSNLKFSCSMRITKFKIAKISIRCVEKLYVLESQ